MGDLIQIVVAKYNYWIYVVLMMIGFYAMIGKRNLVKKLLGMNIFQTAIILFFVSTGVKKVATREDLEREAQAMLDKSELIIAQEFLPTEFDWRIGVLDRRAIYACRYDMVRNHWQIYDHTRKRGSS